MDEQQPPKKRQGPVSRPMGTAALGKDQGQGLQGIAPAVVDAFLSAGKPKDLPSEPLDDTVGLFAPPAARGDGGPLPPDLALPRSPESLGAFSAAPDSPEVQSRFKKIQALAKAAKVAAEAPPEPEAPAAEEGTGQLDPLAAKLLAGRQKPRKPGSPTGQLGGAGNDVKLQHLAMRAKAKKEGETGRLERTVEAALGEKGAVRLRQSLKALEDKALPGKLSALAESVNKLLPEGSEHYAKLGAELGKQVVQNNLNPFLAVSLAMKEAGERLGELEKWDELDNKERITNLAMLTANVSEILGAVTPPPVSYGIQVMGAGMLLVGLATEHSEAVEEIAKVAGGEKAAKAVEKGYNEASNQIASRVRGAWDELNDRLAARRKPKLPPHMQAMVDSAAWRTMKQHPVGQKVATGAENVLYNLSRRYEAFSASWEDKFSKAKKKRKRRRDED